MSASMSIAKFGDGWAKMANLPLLASLLSAHFQGLVAESARITVRELKSAARATSIAPNSLATVILKGSATPLVETGEMLAAIQVKQNSDFDYYAGIDPDATNKKGRNIAELALNQNAGYIITVTNAVRAYLRSAGIRVGNDTQFFIVPPRPFLTEGITNALTEIIKKFGRTKDMAVSAFRKL